jgi:hypothetical protein
MVITSVQLTEEDFNFVKSNHLKFSELLRESINKHKDIISGVIIENIEEERRKVKIWREMAEDLKEFLKEKNLLDNWLKVKGML